MIIVTGAAGFIGSNIVADLQETNRTSIAVIDTFGQENKWLNIAQHAVSAFCSPTKTNEFLEAYATKIECIIHMGGIANTTETNVDLLIENNVNYSVMLWDWCTQHKVPFIYASSSATYGASEYSLKDDESIEALEQLRPLTPYGWTKSTTDLIFARRVQLGKTPPQWVGLKFFNVYGPNEYHKGEMRSVVTKFYDDINIWDAVKLFKSNRPDIEDGQQKRDFVYVKDCSQAVLWFLEHNNISGIYNIGTGNARSFTDVVKGMERVMGKNVEITFKDMPDNIKDRYQYRTEADMSKARSMGLDISFRSLEAGISDYIENYLSKPNSHR